MEQADRELEALLDSDTDEIKVSEIREAVQETTEEDPE